MCCAKRTRENDPLFFCFFFQKAVQPVNNIIAKRFRFLPSQFINQIVGCVNANAVMMRNLVSAKQHKNNNNDNNNNNTNKIKFENINTWKMG